MESNTAPWKYWPGTWLRAHPATLLGSKEGHFLADAQTSGFGNLKKRDKNLNLKVLTGEV